jgi:hypothetical protein
MEDEGYNWDGHDKDGDEEDLAFINDELEDPDPLHSEEIVAYDDEEEARSRTALSSSMMTSCAPPETYIMRCCPLCSTTYYVGPFVTLLWL